MSRHPIDRWLRSSPAYALLVPVFFVAYAVRELDNYASVAEVVVSLAVLVSASFFLLKIFGLLFSRTPETKQQKAGLLLLAFSIPLLFYTDIFYALKDVFGNSAARHRYVVPILLVIAVWIGYRLRKSQRSYEAANHYLNVLTVLVCVVELARVGTNHSSGREWQPYLPLQQAQQFDLHPGDATKAPDIFFILLDGYTGNSSLEKHWQFDNTPFTESLTESGFAVNEQSMSNYNETLNSLASMLNGCYLPNYRAAVNNPITENTICRMWIKDNAVTKALEQHGYEVVNYSLFDVGDAPYYMDYDFLQVHGVSLYRHLFKKTLPGRIHAERYYKTLSPTKGPDLILNVANHVRNAGGKPQFVYAHVMMPHRPYYYDANGNFYPDGEGKFPGNEPANYLEHLQYTNQLVLGLVKQIQSTRGDNVVIVLQGDHGLRALPEGPESEAEGYTTLSAVHLPNGYRSNFDNRPGRSPVNLFARIFNATMGGTTPLLPDTIDHRMHKRTHR